MQKGTKLVSLVQILDIPAGAIWTIQVYIEYNCHSHASWIRLNTQVDDHTEKYIIEGYNIEDVEKRILKFFCPCVAV